MVKQDVINTIISEGKIEIDMHDVDKQFEIEDMLTDEGIEFYTTLKGYRSKKLIINIKE